MDPVLIVAIVVVVLVIGVLFRSVKVIPQAQAAVIERLGRFNKASGAGLVWLADMKPTTGRPRPNWCAGFSPGSRT